MSGGREGGDPEVERRVRASFARQPMMATIGAELREVGPGRVVIGLPRSPGVLQQHGFVHGGAVASIADSAAGYAALSLMPAGTGVLTVEFKINFLGPARAPFLVAEGRVVKSGRTLVVAQAEVFGLDDGKRTDIALLTATMMTIVGRDDVVD